MIELSKEDIKHEILVVKIVRTYEELCKRNFSSDKLYEAALYDAVRGVWKLKKANAEKADYVFGVYKSKIVAVYKPTCWYIYGEAPEKMKRDDIDSLQKYASRVFFVDSNFESGKKPDDNQRFYYGKSLKDLSVAHTTSPTVYLHSV